MKKIRILALTMALCLGFTLSGYAVTTLELSQKLEPVEAEVTQQIEESKDGLLDKAYPVGSVYTTTEDITASDMHRQFGGTWIQMKDTFLWAKDSEEEGVAQENTGILGATGGMRNYKLSAVIGPDDDDDLAFIPYSTSQYMMNPYSYAFRGIGYEAEYEEEEVPNPEDPGEDPEDPGEDPEDPGENPENPGEDPENPVEPIINYTAEGSFSGSIPVTEVESNKRATEIMPPYLAVKMFRRTA